jgi:predicted O-methyltransferase YrrM
MRAEALKPRPECPEPGRWLAPDQWASEADVSVFLGDLAHLLKPDFVVETGAYHGDTSVQIGQALHELGRGHLVSLEVDPERAAHAALATVGLPVSVWRQSSLDYEPTAPIDLLFLDSEFAIRMAELRRFRAWASPRCVVVLHDPCVPSRYPDVSLMLAEMDAVISDGLVYPWLTLPTPRGLALTRYR